MTLERKNPPFAGKREGWGTLKYFVGKHIRGNPRPRHTLCAWGTRLAEKRKRDCNTEVTEKNEEEKEAREKRTTELAEEPQRERR